MKIKVKPLSVNQVWQGRRYKTRKYKSYEEEVLYQLPLLDIDFAGPLSIYLNFGFSNTLSDLDNPVKPILDILQKKYGFNDRDVYELQIKKNIVPKGEEYIELQIDNHEK